LIPLTKNKLALIELHIAVFLFGIAGLFGKFITASPLIIVAGRSVVAAIAIAVVIKFWSLKLKLSSRKSVFIMPLSGLILAIHWLTFFHAIQISTVAIGLIGFATFPIFVTFLEPILYKQKIRAVDVFSAIMVLGGLILVAPSFDLSDSGTAGLLWAVFSAFLFALFTLINRYLVEDNSFVVVAFYQHSTATLVLLPFLIYFAEYPDFNTTGLLLILGLFCTALPHILFIKSLTSIKAQLASVVTGLEPVYAIIFAALFLNEIPNLKTILGAIIVLGAVLLAMKYHASLDDGLDHHKNKPQEIES
jgi:drug/metabolite transporter (DMT)-like permease